MKAKLMCFKLSKTMCIVFCIIILEIVFILLQLKDLRETRNFQELKQNTNQIQEQNIIVQNDNANEITENVIQAEVENTKKEYETMPREVKGYKVVGKISIPKLNLDSHILAETNTKSLKVSVTKLYGPQINKVGNFCIAGHNYRNNKMFGGIKKLENGDKIILTDTYGDSISYQVYENYQTDPKDVSCLNQDTQGERELTLITCTAGAIKRVIVKAVEIYD